MSGPDLFISHFVGVVPSSLANPQRPPPSASSPPTRAIESPKVSRDRCSAAIDMDIDMAPDTNANANTTHATASLPATRSALPAGIQYVAPRPRMSRPPTRSSSSTPVQMISSTSSAHHSPTNRNVHDANAIPSSVNSSAPHDFGSRPRPSPSRTRSRSPLAAYATTRVHASHETAADATRVGVDHEAAARAPSNPELVARVPSAPPTRSSRDRCHSRTHNSRSRSPRKKVAATSLSELQRVIAFLKENPQENPFLQQKSRSRSPARVHRASNERGASIASSFTTHSHYVPLHAQALLRHSNSPSLSAFVPGRTHEDRSSISAEHHRASPAEEGPTPRKPSHLHSHSSHGAHASETRNQPEYRVDVPSLNFGRSRSPVHDHQGHGRTPHHSRKPQQTVTPEGWVTTEYDVYTRRPGWHLGARHHMSLFSKSIDFLTQPVFDHPRVESIYFHPRKRKRDASIECESSHKRSKKEISGSRERSTSRQRRSSRSRSSDTRMRSYAHSKSRARARCSSSRSNSRELRSSASRSRGRSRKRRRTRSPTRSNSRDHTASSSPRRRSASRSRRRHSRKHSRRRRRRQRRSSSSARRSLVRSSSRSRSHSKRRRSRSPSPSSECRDNRSSSPSRHDRSTSKRRREHLSSSSRSYHVVSHSHSSRASPPTHDSFVANITGLIPVTKWTCDDVKRFFGPTIKVLTDGVVFLPRGMLRHVHPSAAWSSAAILMVYVP